MSEIDVAKTDYISIHGKEPNEKDLVDYIYTSLITTLDTIEKGIETELNQWIHNLKSKGYKNCDVLLIKIFCIKSAIKTKDIRLLYHYVVKQQFNVEKIKACFCKHRKVRDAPYCQKTNRLQVFKSLQNFYSYSLAAIQIDIDKEQGTHNIN